MAHIVQAMRREVALLYLFILSSLAIAQDSNSSVSEASLPASTEPTFSGVRFSHKESTTTAIIVEWEVSADYEAMGFRVMVQKEGSRDVIRSPALPASQREYATEDLVMHASYNVCLWAAINSGEVGFTSDENGDVFYKEHWCIDAVTIPIMRDDSVIALVAALGYIILMILIGYLCWRYAKSRMEREEDEETDDTEETKMRSDPYPPPYSPRKDPAIRSSIEDPDIPYITPPIGELSTDEQGHYNTVV